MYCLALSYGVWNILKLLWLRAKVLALDILSRHASSANQKAMTVSVFCDFGASGYQVTSCSISALIPSDAWVDGNSMSALSSSHPWNSVVRDATPKLESHLF